MRKLLLGFVVVAAISAVFYLRFHHAIKPPLEIVYAGSRQITLWNSIAQIRGPIATAGFGDRLDVLGRYGDQVQVRTSAGIVGWANSGDVLSSDIWQQVEDLNQKTSALPVEAHGQTRVIGNMHLAPGREALRIRQLNKDIPVDLFERQPVDLPGQKPAALQQKPDDDNRGDAQDTVEPRKEDWWLIRANLPDNTSESGWILGRFIDLSVPEPLPDYASAADMHIGAWFELNRVPDSSGTAKPQYLVVGSRGSEGQPCDFTLLRVFTWGNKRQRYETAYVESDICGKLPVTVKSAKAVGGDAAFSFEDSSEGAPENRVYRMHQTIVRRVRAEGELPPRRNLKR